MSQGSDRPEAPPPETPPLGQRVFDNIFLLLVAGIVIVTAKRYVPLSCTTCWPWPGDSARLRPRFCS